MVSTWFNSLVIFAICFAGILVGIATYPAMQEVPALSQLEDIIQYIFTFDVVVKILAEGWNPINYW